MSDGTVVVIGGLLVEGLGAVLVVATVLDGSATGDGVGFFSHAAASAAIPPRTMDKRRGRACMR